LVFLLQNPGFLIEMPGFRVFGARILNALLARVKNILKNNFSPTRKQMPVKINFFSVKQ